MEELLYKIENHVATITINRPQYSNAYNAAVWNGMVSLLWQANHDDDVWCIVITGAGDRAFCAGADLKEMREKPDVVNLYLPDCPGKSMYEALLETYKPTIAALNGSAIGGGLEIALAADIRIAADDVKLCFPEAKRGLGCSFGVAILPRLIPYAVAMEFLYLGEYHTAKEMERWGLINKCVPREDFQKTVDEYTSKIVNNAPITERYYKHMAAKGRTLPITDAYRLAVGPNPYTSEDRREGVSAYVEKRPPVWKNK